MKNNENEAKKKVILVITDGIGHNESSEWNAFYHAKKPHYDWLFQNAPHALLCTFGTEIGLPAGQMGNSEVGHMCMGAGRVLYQDLVRISMALEPKNGGVGNDGIESCDLAANPTLNAWLEGLKVVHLCGLLSDGGVHSHISHTLGLAKILEARGKKIYIHAITDGRDVEPTSAKRFIETILALENENIRLATIMGRFFAMDRDNRAERTKAALDCLTGAVNPQENPLSYLDFQYAQNITDEFVNPASFGGFGGIKSGEGLIFTNFRSDRARQIVRALGDFRGFGGESGESCGGGEGAGCVNGGGKNGEGGKNSGENNAGSAIKTLTMCEYDETFDFPVLFKKDKVQNTLAEILSERGLRQAHIAETEKYAHVTFFFNGGREEEFALEERVLIPSPKVKTYDLKPEMSAAEVCDAVLAALEREVDFVVVNFANGDMVGHTGDFHASIKAVEAVDTALGRILAAAKKRDYSLIITSDHGNCEKMRDESGAILTNHTAGFVWCFVLDDAVKSVKAGGLDNIAPSILKLFGIKKPDFMSAPLF